MKGFRWPSFLISVVVPFVGVIGTMPFINRWHAAVWGIPMLFFWIFLWFPLTFLCLAIAWYAFDRKDYLGVGTQPKERGDES
jgi:hypothetical protein